jgi:hypothetical protein
MQVFSSHRHVLELPAGHRFPAGKSLLLYRRVQAECGGVRLADAEAASVAELALAHDPAYVRAVFDGSLPAAADRKSVV